MKFMYLKAYDNAISCVQVNSLNRSNRSYHTVYSLYKRFLGPIVALCLQIFSLSELEIEIAIEIEIEMTLM